MAPIYFTVRSGQGGPDGVGGFTDIIELAVRVPRLHAGWVSVRWRGECYPLRGGIRGGFFIITRWPIAQSQPRPPRRRPPSPPTPDPPRRRVRVVDI
jgi:hypothetical protein